MYKVVVATLGFRIPREFQRNRARFLLDIKRATLRAPNAASSFGGIRPSGRPCQAESGTEQVQVPVLVSGRRRVQQGMRSAAAPRITWCYSQFLDRAVTNQ
jgi:hypothetical protein